MNADRKSELKNAYRAKQAIGGVCAIRCSGSSSVVLQVTRNIEGLRNRFNFAVQTDTAPDPSLRAEWARYGIASFSFEVLEKLEKRENQTDREFADDIETLCEIWREKLDLTAPEK